MFKFLKLQDLNIKNKIVLLRLDLNVPLKFKRKKAIIEDDNRIKKALPTIEYCMKNAKKTIIITHLGRPEKRDKNRFNLDVIANKLSKLLKIEVRKINGCIGEKVEKEIKKFKSNKYEKLILLENLRFYEQEEKNDKRFARKLASYSNIYVNDAFSVSHRKHASIHAITNYIKSCAGFQLQNEVEKLNLVSKKRPLMVLLGGSKLETKISLIKNLHADMFLIAGKMCFAFLEAQGYNIGETNIDKKEIVLAKEILKLPKIIILPVDIIIGENPKNRSKVAMANNIPDKMIGYDIGPKTVDLFKKHLERAKTIFWNGPLGYFEERKFDSTKDIGKFLSNLKSTIIIGGGETVDALNKYKINENKFSFVSTGGGASLAYISGEEMPGLKALDDAYGKFSKN